MSKTNKMLHKYVADLLKYSENSGVFNPCFYTHEIPEIFSGWSETEFNIVHHGVGEGCCTIIGAGRYKINIAHCNRLHNEFIKEEKEEQDAMMRSFDGIPLAHELAAMSEIELADQQSKLAANPRAIIIIENEWQRRKSSEVPNPAPNPSTDQTNNEHNWQSKILIYIAVGVVIVVLGAFAIHLIKKHCGIPL